MEQTEEQQTEKKGGAKTYSKISMILGSLWIVVGTILRAVGVFVSTITESDIITSGFAIMAVWSPTYISMWLDKLTKAREPE